MKIIVTGSLGHISQPLIEELVQKGYAVTVISSKPEKQQALETPGATAAIGSLEDAHFLAAAVTGANAVYAMVRPIMPRPIRLPTTVESPTATPRPQAAGSEAGGASEQLRGGFRSGYRVYSRVPPRGKNAE